MTTPPYLRYALTQMVPMKLRQHQHPLEIQRRLILTRALSVSMQQARCG
jgi:hypothetical protein